MLASSVDLSAFADDVMRSRLMCRVRQAVTAVPRSGLPSRGGFLGQRAEMVCGVEYDA
jgi:hypothetical protein